MIDAPAHDAPQGAARPFHLVLVTAAVVTVIARSEQEAILRAAHGARQEIDPRALEWRVSMVSDKPIDIMEAKDVPQIDIPKPNIEIVKP